MRAEGVVERLERAAAEVSVGVPDVREQRSIVWGSSPSPASNGTSGVEVMRPKRVCQALTAAGRARRASAPRARTACAARSGAARRGSGGRAMPRGSRTAPVRAPPAARSTRGRRTAARWPRRARGRPPPTGPCSPARSRRPTRAGGRTSSPASSLSIAESSSSASARPAARWSRACRGTGSNSRARSRPASSRRRASSAPETSGDRSQWIPAARGPVGTGAGPAVVVTPPT